ncbi:MAG TPA: hypothetical protein QF764_07710 [Planctomycetota bacterium]|nr:hypothetical protein [Planctomycetota bacterium]
MLTLLLLESATPNWATAPEAITLGFRGLIAIAAGLLLLLLVGGLALILVRLLRRSDRPRSPHRLFKVLLACLAMAAGASLVLARAPSVERVNLILQTEPPVPAEVWIDGDLHGHTPMVLTNDDLRSLLVPLDQNDPLTTVDMIGRHLCPSTSATGWGRLCPNVIGLHFNFHALTVERPDGTQLWVIHKNDMAGGQHATLRIELRDAETGETIPYRRDEWTRDRTLNFRRYRHTFLFGPSRRIDFGNRVEVSPKETEEVRPGGRRTPGFTER